VITPILRLVLIYLALIAAVVAVFNRDKLATLVTGGGDAPIAAPAQPAPAPVATPAPVAAQPAPADPRPTYGSDLQAPVATPDAQPSGATAAGAAADDTDTAIATAVNAARAAFWTGDVEGARAQMLALVAAHPDDAGLLGELGNLQFALRDYPAAAEAWHRAGLILIDEGQGPSRLGFLQTLGMIDPDKAADLVQRAQGR
jgi:hypothetical protein